MPAKKKAKKTPVNKSTKQRPKRPTKASRKTSAKKRPQTSVTKKAGERKTVERATLQQVQAEATNPKLLQRRREMGKRIADRERRKREQAFDRSLESAKRTVMAYAADSVASRHSPLSLRILAEGDSWFDFPFGGRPFRNGDVIARLRELVHCPILNMAVRGDEVRLMLGAKQRKRIEEQLSNRERDFNVLLFSGGGNDIVGEPFCLWIKSRDAVQGDARAAIDETSFSHALGIVRAGYEQLIEIRDSAIRVTPGRRIAMIIHAYDHAIPTGIGVCGYGPWLKPSLAYRGWTDDTEAKAIVKSVLSRFADMLRELSRRHDDVFFVESQGSLHTHDWNDELHPNRDGFGKIATRFHQTLQRAFPGQLP